MEKRVIIIDTSNEIGGDSDIPHYGIGRARRMQVQKTEFQHQIMMEAIENHMPEIVVIDEIGTELEALAARTIAEKGVQLVGTTHGNCLDNLIKNPTLSDLIGGIQYVTLSDDEAKRRGTQKSILERKAYPAFQIAIEINDQTLWTIHENVQNSIDLLLRENCNFGQIRQIYPNQKIHIKYKKIQSDLSSLFLTSSLSYNSHYSKFNDSHQKKYSLINGRKLLIYTYLVSPNLIKEVISKTGSKFVLTKDIKKANLIIGLKKYLKQNLKLKKFAQQKNIPIYIVNRATVYQIAKLLQVSL
jgi:hypothetical protein